jgi:hypothetical protein
MRDYAIERRMPIGRYQEELVALVVDIPDFTGLFRAQKIEVCVFQFFHIIPQAEAKPYWPESM